MKILFINAQDNRGGAAVAPYRLSKGLESLFHTENYFIVGKKHSADSNVFCTRQKDYQAAVEFLTDKVFNKLGLQYQYFPFSTGAILNKAREFKPDIISLHNTHEGYFKTSLLKKLSRLAPIVWTLHDMWSFTANAVNTFGDESWKQMKSGKGEKKIYPHIGLNTGRWLLKQKLRIYRKSDIHLVTPSRWMTEMARRAPVFENKPIHYITHGVDLDFFAPRDKVACRKVLGIAPGARVLIFVSAGDLEICPWKGGPLLIDILKTINNRSTSPIDVILLGKGRLQQLENLKNITLHRMGYVSSEAFLPILLSAADLFIYPTRADSLGLVLVEAIACGVPAVSFDIGGCGDVITDGRSGYLIPPFDVDAFVDKSLELLDDEGKLKKLSAAARRVSEERFSLNVMARKHYELFQSLVAVRSTGAGGCGGER
jgi:glycosyltransferase involved in cell wall biosynthesis